MSALRRDFLGEIFIWCKKKVSVQYCPLYDLSALQRFFYENLTVNHSVPRDRVRLKQMSALYHVRFRQIPLQEHQPKYGNSIQCETVWHIYIDKEQSKETSQKNSGFQFSWKQFQEQRPCRAPIQFRRERQSQRHKNNFS